MSAKPKRRRRTRSKWRTVFSDATYTARVVSDPRCSDGSDCDGVPYIDSLVVSGPSRPLLLTMSPRDLPAFVTVLQHVVAQLSESDLAAAAVVTKEDLFPEIGAQ